MKYDEKKEEAAVLERKMRYLSKVEAMKLAEDAKGNEIIVLWHVSWHSLILLNNIQFYSPCIRNQSVFALCHWVKPDLFCAVAFCT